VAMTGYVVTVYVHVLPIRYWMSPTTSHKRKYVQTLHGFNVYTTTRFEWNNFALQLNSAVQQEVISCHSCTCGEWRRKQHIS